jgi:hypothetical protein
MPAELHGVTIAGGGREVKVDSSSKTVRTVEMKRGEPIPEELRLKK